MDLISVCKYLDFPEEGILSLQEAYTEILKNEAAAEIMNRWIMRYKADIHLDFKAALKDMEQVAAFAGVSVYTVNMLLFLLFTDTLKEYYKQAGICEQIFKDSCQDLLWKLRECKKVYNIWGSFVAWWFGGFFNMTRFALGRLQYELIDTPKSYSEWSGQKKIPFSKVINMHIPSCGPLTKEACKASFLQAVSFFDSYFEGDEVPLYCESWLLFKGHQEFLPADSGIVQFMEWFSIYCQEESNHDLWRIYNKIDCSDYQALQEDTALQKGYKKLLLSGKKAGFGEGIFFYHKKTGQFSK